MESQSGAVNECRQKDKITLTCTLSTLINNKDNKKFSDWAARTALILAWLSFLAQTLEAILYVDADAEKFNVVCLDSARYRFASVSSQIGYVTA